jgi:type IV pilus assembly protein PilY1
MPRTLAAVFAMALAVLLALPAQAQNANACWNRDLERMDYLANPPEHGDNQFFTTVVAQTANVTLLYAAKKSMLEFTQRLYRIRVDKGGATPTGCTNAYLNALTYFMPSTVTPPAGAAALQGTYKSATTYPDPDTTYSGGGGVSDGFASGSYYRYQNWPANGGGVAEDANTACTTALTAVGNVCSGSSCNSAANIAACVSCVQNSGYFLNPFVNNNDVSPAAGVFSGNWLNFNPPKWALLHLAYKRLVNGPLLSTLREAVAAPNGATGGQVVQKMLPQSCQGQGRPLNQKLGAIDGLTYTSAANPIAEMMFNTAWYMGGQQSPWWFGTGSTAAMAVGKSGPCNGCNADFEVLFSDGRGDTGNPNCVATAGITPAYCTAAASCSTVGMGAEMDGDDYLDPAKYADVSASITGSLVRLTPGGTCDMDFADDVAGWMSFTDVAKGTAGTKINSYVVGIGDPNNTYGEMSILREIAGAGNGIFLAADNFANLEYNIEQVFQAIIKRATSFSVAAISTVQTRGTTFAFIPRFRPLQGAQWEGRLLRFKLFNEFAAGCTSADYGVTNSRNPNGNSSCSDVYLQDSNSAFIGEDPNGNFVQLDTSQAYGDAGWPIKYTTLADGGKATTPAVPVWEAASVLASREDAVIAGTSSDVRTIYTVAPDGGSYGPGLVQLTVANASAITPLLQHGGWQGDFCISLQSATRHTYATDDDCTKDVIRFMNGEDVMVQNPKNRVTPQPNPLFSRPNILGDIFHSSPVLIQPPADPFLCDFGVINQCLATLYNSSTPNSSQAYLAFQADAGTRPELLLVGADDGMLHAFNAGTFLADAGPNGDPYDLGTGRETWAFIPPDMMPKLQRYIINTRHDMLVDGTPMIRDIWVDGSGSTLADRQKQADEFHTIAIIGEREGGRHYSALDITNPNSPKYLWTFPPPGSATSLEMGESWDDISPSAPAIGPIAVDDPSGPYTVNGTKASERWIFAFGGGFDPSYVRGRGIYVIDAWTGQLLFQYRQIDATGPGDARSNLWPVSAPVSLIDTNGDGLFDNLVAPDTNGQVWLISLFNPGKDTGGGGGLFNNWFGARAFIEMNGSALFHRHPFMQRAAVAQMTNPSAAGITGAAGTVWRVLLGSGSRDQIKDGNGGTCGIANLDACRRKDCTVDVNQSRYRIGAAPQGAATGHFYDSEWQYTSGGTSISPATYTADTLTQQSDCTSADDVNITYNITCGGTLTSYPDTVYCDWNAAGVDGGVECPTSTGRPLGTKIAYTAAVTMESSRFYSFTLFDMGMTGANARKPFLTATDANNWDANLPLSESNLVDVTAAAAGTNNLLGWYVRHINAVTGQTSLPGDEKTSASPLVLAGCALWQTLLPNPAQANSCGATLPVDNGYTYQGDVATGKIACGGSGGGSVSQTYRSLRSDAIVAPQQATPVVSVNSATRQTMISGIALPVGAQPLQISLGVGLPRGDVHWLELTPQQHNCRHNGTGCAQ